MASLGETQLRPITMLLRKLMAMDVEESLRGNLIDGVVLLGGRDKSTLAQLLGGAACGTVALHTAPEVAAGGPLAVVQSGSPRRSQLPRRTPAASAACTSSMFCRLRKAATSTSLSASAETRL